MTADLVSFITDDLGDFDAEGGRTADVIASLHELGRVDDDCLDVTYGEGVFWRIVRPARLVTNDLRKPADHAVDIFDLDAVPAEWRGQFPTVAYDPPYKLNGTPTDTDRYGVDVPATVARRKADIDLGLMFAAACVAPGGYLISKVQNQVANGQYHDLEFTNTLAMVCQRWRVDGRIYMPHNPRPQRSQSRLRNNLSIFTIYRRPRK